MQLQFMRLGEGDVTCLTWSGQSGPQVLCCPVCNVVKDVAAMSHNHSKILVHPSDSAADTCAPCYSQNFLAMVQGPASSLPVGCAESIALNNGEKYEERCASL